ncbi:MAG: hypothetical protein B7C24_10530 [Bacteroidetes bacterium 4572_77]|nr:MAG: hypothetical protein B7C24_10530 [Bacteroidetes bacterium 4572_77]
MQTWFSCKVKYQKIDEHGKQIRASEAYLVEAINFTEAETRIFEIMEQYGNGDIMVSGISKTNFTDIVNYEDGQYWYKAKVTYEDMDEASGKVSRVTNHFLVAANSVKQTFERVEENLETLMVAFEIPAISISPILDVFPLFDGQEKEEAIPDNLTPLAEFEAKNNNMEELVIDETDLDADINQSSQEEEEINEE